MYMYTFELHIYIYILYSNTRKSNKKPIVPRLSNTIQYNLSKIFSIRE